MEDAQCNKKEMKILKKILNTLGATQASSGCPCAGEDRFLTHISEKRGKYVWGKTPGQPPARGSTCYLFHRTTWNTGTPLGRTSRTALHRHALEGPPPAPVSSLFNPRVWTKNANMILLVLCLKLFWDIHHSQNKTHAPSTVSKVLGDLLLPVHPRDLFVPPLTPVLSYLGSNKPSPCPLWPWFLEGSLKTALSGSQHQRQWLPMSKSPSPEDLTNDISIPSNNIASNKYPWIKNQEVRKSGAGRFGDKGRVRFGDQSYNVPGGHHLSRGLYFHTCRAASRWWILLSCPAVTAESVRTCEDKAGIGMGSF